MATHIISFVNTWIHKGLSRLQNAHPASLSLLKGKKEQKPLMQRNEAMAVKIKMSCHGPACLRKKASERRDTGMLTCSVQHSAANHCSLTTAPFLPVHLGKEKSNIYLLA